MAMSSMSRCQPLRPPGGRVAARLFVAAAALLIARSPFEAAPAAVMSTQEKIMQKAEKLKKRVNSAMAGPRMGRSKVLFEYRDYQLVVILKKRTLIPQIFVRPTPPPPVALKAPGFAVEGEMASLRGFPFTTTNKGSVQIGFPKVEGKLRITLKDPPASLDAEDSRPSLEVSYAQKVPGLDEASVSISNGDWKATFAKNLEDIGNVHGWVDSQLDWRADLDTSYPPVKGVTPSVTYSATQDGMALKAKVQGALHAKIHGSYEVGNSPGKYAPVDFRHDATVTATSGAHTLAMQGIYDRRLPKLPVWGALRYKTNIKGAELEGSVDSDRYRLSASRGGARMSASAVRKGAIAAKPVDLEVQLGQVAASAHLVEGAEPRFRLSYAR